MFFENARQKDIELINEIPENVQVLADEPMLATITRNLVNNAIKFTQSGGEVRISCCIINDKNEPVVKLAIKPADKDGWHPLASMDVL